MEALEHQTTQGVVLRPRSSRQKGRVSAPIPEPHKLETASYQEPRWLRWRKIYTGVRHYLYGTGAVMSQAEGAPLLHTWAPPSHAISWWIRYVNVLKSSNFENLGRYLWSATVLRQSILLMSWLLATRPQFKDYKNVLSVMCYFSHSFCNWTSHKIISLPQKWTEPFTAAT